MTQRIARLLLDPGRIGIRDADEDHVRACGGATKVLQMSVVEGLEAPVNHAGGHWSLVLARKSTWLSRSRGSANERRRMREQSPCVLRTTSQAMSWLTPLRRRRPPRRCRCGG